MVHKASAQWQGSGKEGSGTIATESKVLVNVPYNWRSRFSDGTDTNPEELIAAAHSSCFTMKLSFVLGAANFTPENIETSCAVTIEDGTITSSHLSVVAKVSGITADEFTKCAEEAKLNCPVSKLLKATITMDAKLA